MILKQLLEDIHDELGWWGIVDHLIKLYPEDLKNADGYLTTIAELLVTEPGDSDGFSLCIEMEYNLGPYDDPEDAPWAHVFGKNGKTNRDNDDNGWHIPDDPTPAQVEWYDSEAAWAIELSPWEELLAMEVVTDLPLPDALVHILWEITFFGYSNDAIKERNAELMSDTEEIKERLAKEKGE